MKKMKLYLSQKDSKNMLQYKKETEFFLDTTTENLVINIYEDKEYQKILGFGGAFTEASAFNYSKLSEKNKKKVLEAYFDPDKGLGYNFCRTHIHSCDFTVDSYTYTEEDDKELKTFSIERDRKYVMPFLKAAQEQANDLLLFASPWSPPAWMKDNNSLYDGGHLRKEYYKCWAKYMTKYFAEYAKAGVDFFALTIQNEAMAVQTWESCVYTAEEEAAFACNFLKPELEQAGLGNINIMIWDHNKERVYDRARDSFKVAGAKEKIWGVAFHWYSGDHFAALDMAHESFPDKPLILTEYCLGGSRGETAVGPHSSWVGAEIYVKELISNFNHHMAAAVDWNMLIDEDGGPYHNRERGCKSLIVANHENDTVSLEPTYYALAHFSKFVKRDAIRLGTSSFSEKIPVVAFKNPDGSIAVVLLNTDSADTKVFIRLGNATAQVQLPQKSLVTCVID